MLRETGVRTGQVYKDKDWRMNGRIVKVIAVNLQEQTVGRFKARYTYATCVCSPSGAKVKIDTDRLRSYLYELIENPEP